MSWKHHVTQNRDRRVHCGAQKEDIEDNVGQCVFSAEICSIRRSVSTNERDLEHWKVDACYAFKGDRVFALYRILRGSLTLLQQSLNHNDGVLLVYWYRVRPVARVDAATSTLSP